MTLAARICNRTARIAIVGTGYVGLPTAVRFATSGFTTVGIDVRAEVVEAINRGESPLADVVPNDQVAAAQATGRLRASLEPSALGDADAILITVGTPVDGSHRPDLSQVQASVDAIAPYVKTGALVVLESTVFPGATRRILGPALGGALLAYCPERVVPGDASKDVGMVDRVVGGANPEALEVAKLLYQAVTDATVHAVSSMEAAEAVKAYENTQRDMIIALGNEMAFICERLGLDAYEVLRGAATKWNVAPVRPGAGVGGHCLPVDPWYLHHEAADHGYNTRLIPAARQVNDSMPLHVLSLVQSVLPAGRIVCLGLAYKEEVADCRESPSLVFIAAAEAAGYEVRVVDPHVKDVATQKFDDAIVGADAVVLMTAHAEFLQIDWGAAAKSMRTPLVVDGRGVYDVPHLQRAGLRVKVLGRGDLP